MTLLSKSVSEKSYRATADTQIVCSQIIVCCADNAESTRFTGSTVIRAFEGCLTETFIVTLHRYTTQSD